MAARLEDLEIVVVHYLSVRPTVAMLRAFFRHYPEATITLVDNSGGRCCVDDLVLPHLKGLANRIRILVNSATDHGSTGPLSHGGGIDLARRQCVRPYLLSMETDTFVLGRGGVEYALSLMDQGYDWAGVAQKPVGGSFANFSPCFAIFRVDLLDEFNLSFRRRPRSPEDRDPADPLILHHRQAAQRVQQGLSLEYSEGKPPDTYRRTPEQIIAIELQHIDYFDTGEWVHHFLTQRGYRGHLFRSPSSICHTWGSRDEAIFFRNFRERLPNADLNEFLPAPLKLNLGHGLVPLECLALLESNGVKPAPHWNLKLHCASAALTADENSLLVTFRATDEQKVYVAMGDVGFDKPPPDELGAKLSPGTFYSLECTLDSSESVVGQLWVIEYGEGVRVQHHVRRLSTGENTLEFVSSPTTNAFRVLFRFTGAGAARISNLALSFGIT